MGTELVLAAALMLVFQGLQCLLGPQLLRAIWLQLAAQSDEALQRIGIVILTFGMLLAGSVMWS